MFLITLIKGMQAVKITKIQRVMY